MLLSGGHIRKVSYGQSGKTSQVYYAVGGNDNIIAIINDDDYFNVYSKRRFLVMKKSKDQEAYIWKELLDIPIDIEYFDPDRMPKQSVKYKKEHEDSKG